MTQTQRTKGEVLWQRKRQIQKERWYQRERNKEISVLKKESKYMN
jgi:hypothetical protein